MKNRYRCPRPRFLALLGISFLMMLMLPTSCRRSTVPVSVPTEMKAFDSFFRAVSDSISSTPRRIRTAEIMLGLDSHIAALSREDVTAHSLFRLSDAEHFGQLIGRESIVP